MQLPWADFRDAGALCYFHEAEVFPCIMMGGVGVECASPCECGVACLVESVVAVADIIEDIGRGIGWVRVLLLIEVDGLLVVPGFPSVDRWIGLVLRGRGLSG